MRTDYTEVFRDPKAVEKYAEETYAPGTFSSVVSERQRQWLRGFVSEAFDAPPVQHDFACGTGRAMRMLEGAVAASHGYDTSEAMLTRACETGVPGELHLIRETGPLPTSHARPTLVTMFRLLLNASDEVRDRAMEFARGMLPDRDSGLLVCENHGNARSIRHVRAILRRHDTASWFAELGHAQVLKLLDRHGFELVARQGFTMLTQGFYRRAPLSWIAPKLDDAAARRGWTAAVATDVVYVARRK
ncbi:MAG: SAM-dependent methyltransferase [Stackebrandtia sp.]